MKANVVRNFANDLIFDVLGVSALGHLSHIVDDELMSGSYNNVHTFEISPKHCGVFGNLVEKMQCRVTVGYDPMRNNVHVNFDFNYVHPDDCGGGRNGILLQKYVHIPGEFEW